MVTVKEKQDLILKTLEAHGCLTAHEVSMFIKRDFNEVISPQSISGNMRSMAGFRKVGSSRRDDGKVIYWRIKE